MNTSTTANMFQSSPSWEAGATFGQLAVGGLIPVSILTQPGSGVQQVSISGVYVPTWFQSAPSLDAGCNATHSGQVHQGPGVSILAQPGSWAAGCNTWSAVDGAVVIHVSILTQLGSWVRAVRSPQKLRVHVVSIRTQPGG